MAVLLAGVSLMVLGLPAFAAELSPGFGQPWILDTPGTFTISGADTSAENAWIGLDTPGVILAIDGSSGPASLTISATKSFHLGINNGAAGEITTLTGTSIVNTAGLISGDQVFVGEGSDDNSMTLNAYSTVSGTSLVLGVNAGSDGNLLELKTGTSLVDLSSNLIVGNSGANNDVTVDNGAVIDADGQVILGLNATADGNSLTLSNSATVTADIGTMVGDHGSGNSILVQSGADYTTYTTTLGSAAGSDGNSFTVTGAGSTYTGTIISLVPASFNVGDSGKQNTLTVSAGGVVSFGDRLAIGKTATGTDNIVTVTGVGSELYAGNVRVGANGGKANSGNSLVVADHGYVSVVQDIKVRANNSIDLSSGASLDVAGFTLDVGSTFKLDVDASNAIDFNVNGTATLAGTIEANHTDGTLTNRYLVLSSNTYADHDGADYVSLDASGFAPGFTVTLDADGNDLYLDIAADLGGAADLGQNQQNLADAINDAFGDGETLSASLVDLFGIPDGDLNAALSGLDGEINAYVQTELGWSATEAVLGTLTGSDLCAPEAAGGFCVKAFAAGEAARLEGDAVAGNHDTAQSGFSLGVASGTLLSSETLLSGLVSIDQSHADVDGLGTADVTSLRFGGSIKQNWSAFYASVAATGGLGMGHVDRDFSSATPGSASADLTQVYAGARAEIGADVALADSAVLTPFAAVDWASNATAAYTETGAGEYADLALAYGDSDHARSSAELGLRLATAPSDAGFVLSGALAYRHIFAADSAVDTRLVALDGYDFAITPATQPVDQLRISADASVAVGDNASLSARLDAGFAEGYQSVAGKVGLTGQW